MKRHTIMGLLAVMLVLAMTTAVLASCGKDKGDSSSNGGVVSEVVSEVESMLPHSSTPESSAVDGASDNNSSSMTDNTSNPSDRNPTSNPASNPNGGNSMVPSEGTTSATSEASQTSSSVPASVAGAAPVVEEAQELIGTPYVYGSASPEKGFDSSGFTYYVFSQAGLILPRTVTAQAQVGSEISWDVMRPGDILFFYTDQPGVPQFCGILESDGVMIYSGGDSQTVQRQDITGSFWQEHFVSARRVLE